MAAKRRMVMGRTKNILLVDVSAARSALEGRETEPEDVRIMDSLLFVSRWSLALRLNGISNDLCEPDAVKEREGWRVRDGERIGLGV